MLKKVILSVAVASTLVIAMGAYADDMDSPLAATDSSSDSGLYVGAQAGYGTTDIKKVNSSVNDSMFGFPITDVSKTNKGGFDGRAYLGYKFNTYLGLELGGSYLPHSNYKETQTIGSETQSATATLDQYAIDLMAMGYLPISDTFYAFGGVGGAYVFESVDTKGSMFPPNMDSKTKGYLRPKVVVGLGYRVTSNIAVTASYSRIFGNKGENDPIGIVSANNNKITVTPNGVHSINEFTAGVQYSF